jgi:hypothetical protein
VKYRTVARMGASAAAFGVTLALASLANAGSSPSAASRASQTLVFNGFGIGSDRDDLIAASGTTAGVTSVGDVAILNDQLTTTHKHNGGYPVVGYDAGSCSYTRVAPDGQPPAQRFDSTYEFCAATAVLPQGSISVQGVVGDKAGTPQTSVLSVSGGTGTYTGKTGTVTVHFAAAFNTYTFLLK